MSQTLPTNAEDLLKLLDEKKHNNSYWITEAVVVSGPSGRLILHHQHALAWHFLLIQTGTQANITGFVHTSAELEDLIQKVDA